MYMEGYPMKRLLTVAMMLVLVPSVIFANDTKTMIDPDPVTPLLQCDPGMFDKYYEFTDFVTVPDCDPTGATTPWQWIEDPEAILDIVVNANLFHTWTGDLNLQVQYDADGDGVPEAVGQLLCRLDFSFFPDCPTTGCCGCSSDLTGSYGFWMGAPSDFVCGALPGCYRPAGPLDQFNGLHKRGYWRLWMQDAACGDIGTIEGWGIGFINGEPTATEPATWGSVRALFR